MANTVRLDDVDKTNRCTESIVPLSDDWLDELRVDEHDLRAPRITDRSPSKAEFNSLYEQIVADDGKRRIVEDLTRVVRSEFLLEWMSRPNKGFGGRRPIDLIDQSEFESIRQMMYEVDSGQPT